MSDVPVQLIVAAFQNEGDAKEALKALKQAKKEGLIKIDSAAILRKDEKGKIHIKETHDMGGGKGAALGGVGGAAVGLIAGAALAAPLAVGALIGGLVAKLRDSGFSDERLETLGESLQPGTSAIIAVVEHEWVAHRSDRPPQGKPHAPVLLPIAKLLDAVVPPCTEVVEPHDKARAKVGPFGDDDGPIEEQGKKYENGSQGEPG